MRLFVGIPLAPKTIEELSAVSRKLRSREDGLRWSTPESWHITLQFLGNTTQDQYGCIVAGLRCLHSPSLSIRLQDPGFFDRAGVFFVGVEPTPPLVSLQQRVRAATEPCGFVPENRPYHPHITLARSKGKTPRQSLRALQSKLQNQPRFRAFVAKEFLLYESRPGPEGSRYEICERFALAGR